MWRAREINADGTDWTDWQPFGRLDGGTFSPALHQRFTEGTLEIAVMDRDGEIWRRWQTGPDALSDWSSLQSPGGDGFLRTDLSLTQNADARLEVFTVADDGQVWHRWQQRADDPESWEQPWHPLGEPDRFSEVAVVMDASTRLTLVATSRDGRELWQRTQVRPSDGWNPNPWVKLSTDLEDSVGRPLLYLRSNGRLGLFLFPETGGLHQRLQLSGGLWPSKDWEAP